MFFYRVNSGTFDDLVESALLAGGNLIKDGYLGDPARGQADPGSAAVYTMDWPGPVICMYVCVGTVFHGLRPTDPLVVVLCSFTHPTHARRGNQQL